MTNNYRGFIRKFREHHTKITCSCGRVGWGTEYMIQYCDETSYLFICDECSEKQKYGIIKENEIKDQIFKIIMKLKEKHRRKTLKNGLKLMELCRKTPSCPYKPLLPEYDVK